MRPGVRSAREREVGKQKAEAGSEEVSIWSSEGNSIVCVYLIDTL